MRSNLPFLPGPRELPDGRRFPWGPVQRVHAIGRYEVVEYLRDNSNLSHMPREADRVAREHAAASFHPYVDGKDTCRSYETLDSALVGAVAHVREGANGSAAWYFDRMTGVATSE